MILLDVNVLLYAYDARAEGHAKARQWLEDALTEGRPVRLAWVTILAFLRITTNPRILANPLLTSEAIAIVNEWFAYPFVAILNPGERHWGILTKLMADAQVRGPLVTDTHLAALAIEYGAQVCTADRDFARFTGLRLINPLA
jgi:toxin-antitoxin system PIN domain toxin